MKYEICNIKDFDEQQYAQMYRAADAERRARADRFRYEDDRRRCLCADMLARRMLAKASGKAPDQIAFTIGYKGKPSANVPFYFNVSHSGNYVLCAVSDKPIGVDIEQIKPFRTGMVARYFTKDEAAYIWSGATPATETVTDPEICTRFYRTWTAKESYVKMTGTGISTDLTTVCYDHQRQTVCGNTLITLNAPEGYVISILKSDLA
ncbi:MAG: 4'-phosphopantetheinyl transferase superfamily protein [Clostridia bacterium]|nr:4'-phosphopantetheinyl transferase superfamily protein [Clostridia bacterium]